MKPKAKKVTTGLLAVTAVAIWIPQLLVGVVQKEPQPRGEYEEESDEDWSDDEWSGGDEAGEWSDDASWDDASWDDADEGGYGEELGGFPDGLERAPASYGSGGGDLAGSLAQLSGSLRIFGSQARVNLDELLGASAATTAPATAPQPVTHAAELELRLAGDALVEFARARALTAIIHRDDAPLAMLDDRLVRVGDEVGAGVRVAEITPRRLRLESGGGSAWLSLAPFRTRRAGGDDEDELDEPAATPEPQPVVLTGAPTAGDAAATSTTDAEDEPADEAAEDAR